MRKFIILNIATFLIFIALFYVAYHCLTRDHFLPISISSIIAHSHNLEIKKHLLVLGLLPFYIAAVIFGTALLSAYLGTIIQKRVKKLWSRNNPSSRKNPSLSNLPFSM